MKFHMVSLHTPIPLMLHCMDIYCPATISLSIALVPCHSPGTLARSHHNSTAWNVSASLHCFYWCYCIFHMLKFWGWIAKMNSHGNCISSISPPIFTLYGLTVFLRLDIGVVDKGESFGGVRLGFSIIVIVATTCIFFLGTNVKHK